MVHGRRRRAVHVYSPTIDNTNPQSLRYIVTDGKTFSDVQGRDTKYTVRSTHRGGMVCEVTTTALGGRWRLMTEYVTDPTRDSVVMRNRLHALRGSLRNLKLYVRCDSTMNGNGGGGPPNGGADSAVIDAGTFSDSALRRCRSGPSSSRMRAAFGGVVRYTTAVGS